MVLVEHIKGEKILEAVLPEEDQSRDGVKVNKRSIRNALRHEGEGYTKKHERMLVRQLHRLYKRGGADGRALVTDLVTRGSEVPLAIHWKPGSTPIAGTGTLVLNPDDNLYMAAAFSAEFPNEVSPAPEITLAHELAHLLWEARKTGQGSEKNGSRHDP